MNNISMYFNKSSKKRDLRGEPHPGEERKKVREEVRKLTMQMIPLMMKYFSILIAKVISQKC